MKRIIFISILFLGYSISQAQYVNAEFTLTINPGWNWISINIDNPDMSIGTVLGSLISAEDDYIKSKTQSATWYDGYGWFGELAEIDVQKMYKFKKMEADELFMQGAKVDSCSPIPLGVGWNWIGYPLQSALPIDEALASINPIEGDHIKSQSASATYYEGFGWFGELTQLDPLQGFMIKLSHPENIIFPGCETEGTFIDSRDDHVYKWISIGNQTWMAENLAYLPSVSGSDVSSDVDPYYYVQNYEGTNIPSAKTSDNYGTYGVLYNWEASLSACPAGWHLPSDGEWTILTDYLINNGYGYEGSGDDIGKSMASATHWIGNSSTPGHPGNDQESNNSSGFNALPGGSRGYDDADGFYDLGYAASFWSSTPEGSLDSWSRFMYFSYAGVDKHSLFYQRKIGLSVRCLKDDPNGLSPAYVDLSIGDVLSYDSLSGNVVYDFPDSIPTIAEGSVIVIDADTTGYIRKVISTHTIGGQVQIETEQAFLNDLFIDKDFKLKTEMIPPKSGMKTLNSLKAISEAFTDEDGYIHPVEVIYHSQEGKNERINALNQTKSEEEARIGLINFENDFSNTDLYGEEGDPIHFYISEGNTYFNSDAVFEFDFDYEGDLDENTKVKKGDLKSFMFYLDADAEFQTKLGLDIQASINKSDTKKLINGKKVTAKFIVGPVPVWISFDVDVFGAYSFTADASLHADWGFESKHNMKVGCTYTKDTDNIDPIKEYTPENTIYPLNINGEVNMDARLELYPRVEVKFYSFFGPFAEVVPYVAGNYNATLQSQITGEGNETFVAWDSGIDLGLDFRVGAELTFLWGLYEKEFGPEILNCFELPLWRSPQYIELLTNLPEEAEAGDVISLHYQVTDLLDLPVSFCPVYVSGDGNFSKQLIFTDINGYINIDWTVPSQEGSSSVNAVIYNSDKEEISSTSFVIETTPGSSSIVNSINLSYEPYRAFCDGPYLYYSELSGNSVRRYNLDTNEDEFVYDIGGRTLVWIDGNYLFTGEEYHDSQRVIQKVDLRDGTVVWSKSLASWTFGAGITSNSIYIAEGHSGVKKLDRNTGAINWSGTGITRYCDDVVCDYYRDVVIACGWWSQTEIARINPTDGSKIWSIKGVPEVTRVVDITDESVWIQNGSTKKLEEWDISNGEKKNSFPTLGYNRIWHLGENGSLSGISSGNGNVALVWDQSSQDLSLVSMPGFEIIWTTPIDLTGNPLMSCDERPVINNEFIYFKDQSNKKLVHQFKWK